MTYGTRQALRSLLPVCLACAVGASFYLLPAVLAQEWQLEVAPKDAQLTVFSFSSDSHVNLRRAPDPRGRNEIAKVPVGATLMATGNSKMFGDTWWHEVRFETTVGWVNARLVHLSDATPPPSPKYKIELKENTEIDTNADAYRETQVNWFAECARACLNDTKCQALEYYKENRSCSLYTMAKSFKGNRTVDVGIKLPIIAPPPPEQCEQDNQVILRRAEQIKINETELARTRRKSGGSISVDAKAIEDTIATLQRDHRSALEKSKETGCPIR